MGHSRTLVSDKSDYPPVRRGFIVKKFKPCFGTVRVVNSLGRKVSKFFTTPLFYFKSMYRWNVSTVQFLCSELITVYYLMEVGAVNLSVTSTSLWRSLCRRFFTLFPTRPNSHSDVGPYLEPEGPSTHGGSRNGVL